MVYGTTEVEFRNEQVDKIVAPVKFLDFNNTLEVNVHYDILLQDHCKIIRFSEAEQKNQYLGDTWHNRDAEAVFVSAASFTQELVKAGGEVYLFETRQWPFSFHVSDMQYFIGIHRELEHFPDMDILDTFYSKMLVNFTKHDVPSPEWEKLDLEKMNFLNLQVNTKTGARPEMENNYHVEDMKIWMEDMTEYDRQISAEVKQSFQFLKTFFIPESNQDWRNRRNRRLWVLWHIRPNKNRKTIWRNLYWSGSAWNFLVLDHFDFHDFRSHFSVPAMQESSFPRKS